MVGCQNVIRGSQQGNKLTRFRYFYVESYLADSIGVAELWKKRSGRGITTSLLLLFLEVIISNPHQQFAHKHIPSRLASKNLKDYKQYLITLQDGIDPITGCKLNLNTCVLDHNHYIGGDDGLALRTDYLRIRGILNRASNLFEGLVGQYFISMQYPFSTWSERLRSPTPEDSVVIDKLFHDVWHVQSRKVTVSNIACNLAIYWETEKEDYLFYPSRI